MWIPKVALHRPYTFIAPALLILIASLVGCRKQAERRRMGASVLLVKAVGGGWDAPQLPKS